MNRKVVSPLYIGNNERGILTGQTNTGKSTLANILIRDKTNLLVFDAKRNFNLNRNHEIATTPDEINEISQTGKVILYRPEPEYLDMAWIDSIFHWVYLRKNTFVYIDELTAITGRSAMSYSVWLRNCIVQGRGIGIGMLYATQRPSNLPMFLFSEAQRFWKFFLLLEKDNKRMAEYMGNEVLESDKPAHHDLHSFFYRDLSMRKSETREYVLKLDGGVELENYKQEGG